MGSRTRKRPPFWLAKKTAGTRASCTGDAVVTVAGAEDAVGAAGAAAEDAADVVDAADVPVVILQRTFVD